MNLEKLFDELDVIEREYKDDKEIKQAVKRIKDLLA